MLSCARRRARRWETVGMRGRQLGDVRRDGPGGGLDDSVSPSKRAVLPIVKTRGNV